MIHTAVRVVRDGGTSPRPVKSMTRRQACCGSRGEGLLLGVPGEGPQVIPGTEEAPEGATFTQRPGLFLVLVPGWNTVHYDNHNRGCRVASAPTDVASFFDL